MSKVAVHSQNARAAGRMAKALGGVEVVDDLSATVGNTGTAHAGPPAGHHARVRRAR